MGNPTGAYQEIDTHADAGNNVGQGQAFARGWGNAGAQSGKYVAAALSSVPVLAEALVNAAKQSTGGRADYSWQDTAFRHLVDPTQSAIDYYSLKPEERLGIPSKIAYAVGGLVQDLPAIIASGGIESVPSLAKALPAGMLEFVGTALSNGFEAMRPIILKAAGEKAQQVLDAGGSTQQATVSALSAGMLAGVSGAAPMSLQGNVLTRAGSGFAVGASQGEASRVVQNAADPQEIQAPFEAANLMVEGAQGSVLAAGLPGHTVTPAFRSNDARLTPVTNAGDSAHLLPEAEGNTNPSPLIGPDHLSAITDVLNAPTVEAAIVAAQRAAAPPMRFRIEPFLESDSSNVGHDFTLPAVAPGTDRGGSADRERSLRVRSDGANETVGGISARDAFDLGSAGASAKDGGLGAIRPDVAATARRIAELENSPVGDQPPRNSELLQTQPSDQDSSFSATMNPSGTLMVRGDPGEIIPVLRAAGITSYLPARGGILVAVRQAEVARKVLTDFLAPPNAEGRGLTEGSHTSYEPESASAKAAVKLAESNVPDQGTQAPLFIRGESKDLLVQLREHGITLAVPARGGVVVGRNQANAARDLLTTHRIQQFLGQENVTPMPRETGALRGTPFGETEFAGRTDDIHSVITDATRHWQRRPDIHVLDSMEDAPKAVLHAMRQQDSNGASGNVEGFHWRGGVYLVADALHSRQDVQRVLYHEALGHWGLRGVFGEKLDGVLKEVSAALPREMSRKAREYGFDLSDPRQRLQAAEEVLAELAQSRPELGVVRRAIAAIRTFLREHGIDSLAWTDDEIVNRFILPARGYVERGTLAQPAFSRSNRDLQSQSAVLRSSQVPDVEQRGNRFLTGNAEAQDATRGHLPAGEEHQMLGEETAHAQTIGADRPHDTALHPDQLKSNGENKGDFSADEGIQFSKDAWPHDIRRQGYEVPVFQAGRRLRTMLEKYDEGKLTQPELELKLRMLAEDMSGASQIRQLKAESAERVRGPDWVRERLLRARRTGELDGGSVDLALWALDKNPAIAEGLGLSLRSPATGSMTAGHYNPSERVATLMKDSTSEDTAVHEIMHHTERMMPGEVQKGIASEWSRQMGKAMAGAEGPRKEALSDMVRAMAGDHQAHKNVREAFKSGVLDYDRDYQLTNPSEFWAVNATRILRERAEAGGWVGEAKQWLTELVQKAKGWFGMSSDSPVLNGLNSVLTGDGEFQSKKMLANVKNYEQPSFSRDDASELPDEVHNNAWVMPEPTRADKILYETQDGRIDLKRAQEAIISAGRSIEERFDARQAETLYPGRVAYRTQQFLAGEVRPLLQSIAVNKVALHELSDYLIARHAPERNAQIAKVNPALPDGGAGKNSKGVLMTNDAARRYLEGLSAAEVARVEAVARSVDSITSGTRRLLVEEGLEPAATVSAWESAYQHYVPLFKDEVQTSKSHPIGSGFTVRGQASKRAVGSTAEITNVLAHVLMQREAAITRAEKNHVALSLYGLALSHPNPDFWTVIRPNMSEGEIHSELRAMGVPESLTNGMSVAPTVTSIDPTTNQVIRRSNPLYRSLPGAITVKVAGSDRVVLLNAENPRAARLAANLKNVDGLTQLDIAGSIVGQATRWVASVNTRFNPAFGLVNAVRDLQTGIVNLSSTPLQSQKAAVLKNVPQAIIGIAREVRGDSSRTAWSDLYRQFQEDGAQTGYREMLGEPEKRTKAIEQDLARLMAAGKLTPGTAAHAVLDVLGDFNDAIENGIRLSAYKAGLDSGMSRGAAAKLSRELTVDFNRRGRAGRELGPLYAFFNASMQGTARTIETLKGPAGAKIISGGLSLGVLQALMLTSAGFDDGDVPEWEKARSLIIPIGWRTGEKNYVAIPLPIGLNALPNTGRVLAELTLYGGKDWRKRVVDGIGELAGAMNPLGGGNVLTADGFLRTIAPTVLDPLIELGFNKNFAGHQIERKPISEDGDNRPGFARAREGTLRSETGQAYLGISKAINSLTGGTKYEAGGISPTPERLRYLAETVGGGALRELEKTVDASVEAANGRAVKASSLPLANRFVGAVDQDQVEQSRFISNRDRMQQAQSSLRAAEKAGDAVEYRRILKEHPEALANADFEAVQQGLRELNKLAVATVDNPQKLRQIDAMRAKEMRVFNQILTRIEKAPPTLADKLSGAAATRPTLFSKEEQ